MATTTTTCNSRIVVFDLDETLGYFTELGMFWDALKTFFSKKQQPFDQAMFNAVLDLYPEFLRPGILDILRYLKKKKDQRSCDKLMIYTNNQGPTEWAMFIRRYFETKLDCPLFDQIIAAFKVQGKRVELCRTTHRKTHADLIKCTKLPEKTQICFLDDVYYPEMDNVYYINVKPYVHDLEFEVMATRFAESPMGRGVVVDKRAFVDFVTRYMETFAYIYVAKTSDAQEIDVILAKQILQLLHEFFKKKAVDNNKKTKRRGNNHGKHKKTRKRGKPHLI